MQIVVCLHTHHHHHKHQQQNASYNIVLLVFGFIPLLIFCVAFSEITFSVVKVLSYQMT